MGEALLSVGENFWHTFQSEKEDGGKEFHLCPIHVQYSQGIRTFW